MENREIKSEQWRNYIVRAAQHSRGSSKHWFRYLMKSIDKCGISFSPSDIDLLYNDDRLTPFQRISIKRAFEEGTVTRGYIRSLNEPRKTDVLERLKERLVDEDQKQ
jgi:hypothetical protein